MKEELGGFIFSERVDGVPAPGPLINVREEQLAVCLPNTLSSSLRIIYTVNGATVSCRTDALPLPAVHLARVVVEEQ